MQVCSSKVTFEGYSTGQLTTVVTGTRGILNGSLIQTSEMCTVVIFYLMKQLSLKSWLGSGWSTAVERTPRDRGVMGCDPAGTGLFSSLLYLIRRCNTTTFPI